jgi:hypothetical protein
MIARRLWTAGDHGCKSCRTIRRLHKFRGYCTRCYPIIYRISRIDRGLYRLRGQWAHLNSSTAGIRKRAETELEQIRILEAPIRDGAIGTDIENLLIAIAEHTRAKPEQFEGVRHFFDGCLEAEQRRRIYDLVAQFAESLPGHGFVLSSFVRRQRVAWENAEWDAKLRALE